MRKSFIDMGNERMARAEERIIIHKTFDPQYYSKKKKLIGGKGNHRSFHENIFAWMYPSLFQQWSFGTGKGGFNKYGVRSFIVDFYDPIKKIAYEIDGDSHSKAKNKIKDKAKDSILFLLHGVHVCRISNRAIEEAVLKMINEKGLSILSGIFKDQKS